MFLSYHASGIVATCKCSAETNEVCNVCKKAACKNHLDICSHCTEYVCDECTISCDATVDEGGGYYVDCWWTACKNCEDKHRECHY